MISPNISDFFDLSLLGCFVIGALNHLVFRWFDKEKESGIYRDLHELLDLPISLDTAARKTEGP